MVVEKRDIADVSLSLPKIDPRHRYGHNLHFYFDKCSKNEVGQTFFYCQEAIRRFNSLHVLGSKPSSPFYTRFMCLARRGSTSLEVITEFCKTIGADNKQRQGLIRLAKKNAERLGFLA
ncbi:hypothetical protein J5N97_026090 [Dioscorea zingiberensis]|uniref:Uncharacterized protein n=1 Tax=Dioscorea zingiberensis TaxID=325984 RepID=A0A9D5H6I8_9LILI|nr:hypothetical protein J5N97_026090 [Dioscorea zingiberensis]